VLRRIPGLTNAEGKLYNLARWMHELYPAGEQWAPQLRPKLVADAFVVNQLINSPQLRQALLDELDHASAVAALNLSARAAEHLPAAADMFGQVLALPGRSPMSPAVKTRRRSGRATPVSRRARSSA